MTPEELQQLPLAKFTGAIHLVRGPQDWEEARSVLPQNGVIGFDTESRPSFRKGQWYPPSLVQLATETDAVLVQISHIQNPYEILGEVLENENLLKVGVAIRDDIRFLRRVFTFAPQGFVEIDPMAKKAELPFTGLRKLAGRLLGERLSKGAQVSDWSRNRLSDAQIHYAAADAWVSLKIFEVLRSEFHIEPEPCVFQNLDDEELVERPKRRRGRSQRRRRKPAGEGNAEQAQDADGDAAGEGEVSTAHSYESVNESEQGAAS